MNALKKVMSFFSLAWSISPSYIILLIFNSLIGGGRILINIILPKFLIDELQGARDTDTLILFGGLIVASNLLFAFMDKLFSRLLTVRNYKMTEMINLKMGTKIMNTEYRYLEDPYYLDLKERAVFAITNQSALENIINNVINLMKQLIIFLGVVTIMFTLSWILVALLVLATIISIVIFSFFSKYQITFFKGIVPVNRKYGYYVNLSYDSKLQKDIRLYGMEKMLNDRVTQYNKEIISWFSSYHQKQGKYIGAMDVINVLASALAYGYVSLRVASSKFGARIGLGSFTMYVSSAVTFTTSIFSLFECGISLLQLLSYLDPYMEFMQLPDESISIPGSIPMVDNIESIVFDNVCFTYPKAEKAVLQNVSFEIKKGEKISVVGLNGAGKTTLVKLLCRLYKPDSGHIYINGHDIFEYDHTGYMNELAAVFQDYKLLDFSIEENVTCQEPGVAEAKATELLRQVGLGEKIKELPDGIKTRIGKDYDENGTELSGGQSQKVAIARALNKDSASLIILDEPTSALDPIAEAEIYENFHGLVGNKTAIYISHRMSSSVLCDRVLVLDGGTVSDFDTHDNLMTKTDSLYYKLFNSQAVNYKLS